MHKIPFLKCLKFALFILFTSQLLVGCFFSKEKIVTRVGRWKITEQNIVQKNQLNKILTPQEVRELGVEQLKDNFKRAIIAENYGYKINAEILENEAHLLEKNSDHQNTLTQIKNIFSHQREDYLNIYILPFWLEKTLKENIYTEFEKKRYAAFSTKKSTTHYQAMSFEEWLDLEMKKN